MREIKFRAYDKVENKMYQNVCFYPNADYGEMILTQYTGLKDINGTEVYDGDVLIFLGKNEIVSYENGEWVLGEFRLSLAAHKTILVGNIYENPELT